MNARWAVAVLLAALSSHGRDAIACVIEGCHDGDTCRLRCGQIVHDIRLSCIDAPELSQQPWGQRARDALRSQLRGALRIIVTGTDRYRRVVAELIRDDGRNLGLELVREGYAVVYAPYCNDPDYLAAEVDARVSQRGIWSVPGSQQRPWQTRYRMPPLLDRPDSTDPR